MDPDKIRGNVDVVKQQHFASGTKKNTTEVVLGQIKKICASCCPTLVFCLDPKHFILKSEQNIVKCAEKWQN